MERKDFHHPFTPYDIQQELMEAIYDCIEDGKVGIFESPTGTGKSLSLICASLTWLREHKRRKFDDALNSIQLDDDDPEWMIHHAKEERRKEIKHIRMELEARLEAARKREERARDRNPNGEPPFKRRRHVPHEEARKAAEEQFVLDDYESDDENRVQKRPHSQYSSETTQMMEKLGMLHEHDQNNGVDEQAEDELKVLFCSRTHSQLSQFVGELQRVTLPPGLPPENGEDEAAEHLRHLTLGSRKNLCINAKVLKLGSPTAINERCAELQQPSTPADLRCPYLPSKEDEDVVLDFRDHALASIRDIEDLAAVGSELGICPYYASRPAIGPAEMVTLPYPLLLQPSAREALGIAIKNHIVVIDEAHNLIDALEGIYSVQITSVQLDKARQCLMVYLQKFRNRLKGTNRSYVTQLVRTIDSLLQFTRTATGISKAAGVAEPATLLSGKGADQVNLTKLVRYVTESKLARKVDGYHQYVLDSQAQKGAKDSTTSVPEVPTLTQVSSFLVPLMNPSNEGKFFWRRDTETVTLQYMLLDPSEHFRDVVENARTVILAGGTMSPVEDYKQQLFPYVSDFRTLSCGHLIPTSNLLLRPIAADQEGTLEFSLKGRSTSNSAVRISSVVESLAHAVKGGLVIFFPSYGYLEEVLAQWRKDSMYSKIGTIKPIFADNRNSSSSEDTFKAYSTAITASPAKGAILLSVIGGKLSEGINFSDALGRCVLVVGLPFPNLNTPEWKAKLEYIGQKAVARGELAGKAGRAHAENVCMRAVNQTIGRVIRHKNDWASIVLMDARYAQERIRGKLPGWIKKSLPKTVEARDMKVTSVMNDVRAFFESRAAAEAAV